MTISKALTEFIYQKKLGGLAQTSIDNYRFTLTPFLRYLGPDLPLVAVSYEVVSDYIMGLYEKPLSRASVSSYIRNIRIFLRWVYTEYELPFDPVKIKIPKSPKKVVHIYSDSEIRYIFSSIKTAFPWITARNRAIVALMLDSGLRQCEVCGLLWADIDKERHIMKVTGKGSKERMVPVGDFSIHLLLEYAELCPFSDMPFVFLDRKGNQLTKNAVKLFTNRLERRLPFKLSSHKLRHNFATNYCIDHVHQTGKTDVYDLSILMGHESIETTKKYEHFAHEIIAIENSISHLDGVYESALKR